MNNQEELLNSEQPFSKAIIMSAGNSNFVDLNNLPSNCTDIVVSRITVNTTNLTSPMVVINYAGNLHLILSSSSELDCVFILYRRDEQGNEIQLSSYPFTFSLYLTTSVSSESQTETTDIYMDKVEPLVINYVDMQTIGKRYDYILKVNVSYSTLDTAEITSGNITAIAQG